MARWRQRQQRGRGRWRWRQWGWQRRRRWRRQWQRRRRWRWQRGWRRQWMVQRQRQWKTQRQRGSNDGNGCHHGNVTAMMVIDGAMAMATATAIKVRWWCHVDNVNGQRKGNGNQRRNGDATAWKAQRQPNSNLRQKWGWKAQRQWMGHWGQRMGQTGAISSRKRCKSKSNTFSMCLFYSVSCPGRMQHPHQA